MSKGTETFLEYKEIEEGKWEIKLIVGNNEELIATCPTKGHTLVIYEALLQTLFSRLKDTKKVPDRGTDHTPE